MCATAQTSFGETAIIHSCLDSLRIARSGVTLVSVVASAVPVAAAAAQSTVVDVDHDNPEDQS